MSTASTAATSHRQRYLRDALDELSAGIRGSATNGRQTAIQLGTRKVALEAWEWDVVAEWNDSALPAPDARWRTLVVEALALQSRFHTDLERLSTTDDDAEGDELVRADLHLDAVLAFRILAELQRETGRMVVSGGMDQAKRLTQFRRRLSESLTVAGKALGEAAIKEAEAIAGQSSAAPPAPERIRSAPDKEDKLQALFELEDKLLKRERARETRTPEPAAAATVPEAVSSNRGVKLRLVLAGILVVAVGTWIARGLQSKERPPAVTVGLDRAAFAEFAPVRDVVSRPPSLFIRVDKALWNGIPKPERLALVEQVAKKADAAGYSGTVVRTEDGAIVGQWLKNAGSRLVQPGT